ncbi:Gti1/Pac2 family [Rhizoctonia solani]|uniref:Gti1/Pac2 family n=1 Tax=Rhizoctonia solani TaxID=456999 RepID=A0A8H7H781_9AGAM|nr:Gti1/Pac2 family [Rhizoctonia solani]
MSLPTLKGVTVSSVHSALVIFYAVSLNLLPKVEQRLNLDGRESLAAGDVYVWEERDLSSNVGGSMGRWTDGIKWGTSRVRNDFLFYHERDFDPQEPQAVQDGRLIKQTFSVHFHNPVDPVNRIRKWHMVAYYNQSTVDSLLKVEDMPELAKLRVPEDMFQPARARRGQGRNTEPTSPTQFAHVHYRISPLPTSPHSGNSGISRPHNSPRSPYSHASSSSRDLGFSQANDLHGYRGSHPLTPEPVGRPAPLRRAVTSPGENIQTTVPPEDAKQTGGSSPLDTGNRENARSILPRISSSYPPSGGIPDPRIILPLPVVSRVTGIPRISADDKALSALQTRFMK